MEGIAIVGDYVLCSLIVSDKEAYQYKRTPIHTYHIMDTLRQFFWSHPKVNLRLKRHHIEIKCIFKRR